MSNKPYQEEIQAEIAKLKAMKPNVLPRSRFGDDHHAAIDGQVEVLSRRLTTNQIFNSYEDERQNILDAALEARDWLDGESEAGSPSEGWAELMVSGNPEEEPDAV